MHASVYAELVRELKTLLRPKARSDLRQQVEANRDPDENPTTGKPIGLPWDEAVGRMGSTHFRRPAAREGQDAQASQLSAERMD